MEDSGKSSTADTLPVVIVGGGIGGLMLGAVLRRLRMPFVILERNPQVTPQGAGISLAPNCLRALDQLGLYEKLATRSQELRSINVYRNRESWGTLNFGLAKSWFGYNVHSMERHEFHHMLYEAAGAEETVKLGWNVTDIVDDPANPYAIVKADSGEEIRAGVVVGADGIRSGVRRALARNSGVSAVNTIRFTGRVHMSGYSAPLKHLGSDAVGVGHWMLYDDCTMTTWPCESNRQWFIGVKAPKLAPGEEPDRSVWKGTTRKTINDVYGERFHPFGENSSISSIVDAAERVIASNVFEEVQVPHMVKGRIVLLGDAAHSMTSFFGQGACQAIEDAVELGNALFERAHYGSKDALETYSRVRQERSKDLVAFSDSYAKVHTAKLPGGLGPLVRKLLYKYAPSSAWMWYLQWLYGYQPVVKYG